MFNWRGCLNLFKSFAAQSFYLAFMACDKNWPFLILYEKYRMSSCTICLIKDSDTPMSHAIELLWLVRIVINSILLSQQQIQVFFSYHNDQSETVELPYQRNHHKTHHTLFESTALFSDWYPNISKFSYWSFSADWPAFQRAVSKFLEEYIASWCCFPHRRCPTTVCCTKRMDQINNLKCRQFTHHIRYIYIYSPIHVYILTIRYQ